MMLSIAWHRIALELGISWSLFWSLVHSELPIIECFDLYFSDHLITLNHSRIPSTEIRLLAIPCTDFSSWSNTAEPINYSTLIHKLLHAGTSAIILNLLSNWIQSADHPNNPIKTLIWQYSDHIVSILSPSSTTQINHIELRNYECFLPFTNNTQTPLSPQSILGFTEYEPEAIYPHSLSSPARQVNLVGQFSHIHNSSTYFSLNSFALLSLQKFRSQALTSDIPHSPLLIHFWRPSQTFPTLSVETILGDRSLSSVVRHKIVIVS